MIKRPGGFRSGKKGPRNRGLEGEGQRKGRNNKTEGLGGKVYAQRDLRNLLQVCNVNFSSF